MKTQYSLLLLLLLLGFTQCKSPAAKPDRISDEALMDTLQRRTFNYFWEGAEPNSGLACERIHIDRIYPQIPTTLWPPPAMASESQPNG